MPGHGQGARVGFSVLDAIMSFLSMGGYAAFVWPAFAVAAAVLTGLFLASWRQARAREAELDALPQEDRRAGGRRGERGRAQ